MYFVLKAPDVSSIPLSFSLRKQTYKPIFCFLIFCMPFYAAWFDQDKFSEVLSTLSEVAGKVHRMSTQFSTVVEDGWKKTNDFLKKRTESILTQVGRRQSLTSGDISTIKEQLTLQARNLTALSLQTKDLLSFKQQVVSKPPVYHFRKQVYVLCAIKKAVAITGEDQKGSVHCSFSQFKSLSKTETHVKVQRYLYTAH